MAKAAKKLGAPAERIHDLRNTLEWLKSEGDLIETDKEVDPDLEITAIQKNLDGRLSDPVQQCQGQAFSPRRDEPVRRHGRDQQDVRLGEPHRPHAEARGRHQPPDPAGGGEFRRRARARGDHQGPQGRQRVHAAHPPHRVRAGIDGRLGQPACLRRALRRRHRPRLQPDELPLGQRGHLPDLARIAHVAGGLQVLHSRQARSHHHVLRSSAFLHAAGRGRLRLRRVAPRLRRTGRGRRRSGFAGAGGQGQDRGRPWPWPIARWCWKVT